MSAKDTVRRNKTEIQSILSGDHRFILQKVYEKSVITEREYNNLKSLNKEDAEGHVIELVDKIMNKGEDACRDFLNLLQCDDDIKTTFPRLKNPQLNFRPPEPVQAGSRALRQDGSSQMEERSYSTNKEDVMEHVTELEVKITIKGQVPCKDFQQYDDYLNTAFYETKNEQLTFIEVLLKNEQRNRMADLLMLFRALTGALRQDGSSQMEERSYSTNKEDVMEHVTELMIKGQVACKDFLKLLQYSDYIKTTLSEMKNKQLDDILVLLMLWRVLTMEERSYSTNREDPELGEDTSTSNWPQVERRWIDRSAQHYFQISLDESSCRIYMDLLKQCASEVAEPCFSGRNVVSTIKDTRDKILKNKLMYCTRISVTIITFFLNYCSGETILLVNEPRTPWNLEPRTPWNSSECTTAQPPINFSWALI